MQHDEYFMHRALTIAAKAHPRPNPKVGAVIVKNGKVIAEGFHHKAGQPHAEIIAMKKAGGKTKGATLYLTLEPCTHYGRTPPCIDAVLAAKFKRVVIAMSDPNPLVHGNGIRKLKKAGIRVTLGVLEPEARKLNEAFIHFMKTGWPFVTIKTAMSLDGKIATRTGDSHGLSSKAEQQFVQELRADNEAILVGVTTVLKDNPKLTARVKNASNPLRIILDDTLRTPLNANVLKNAHALIATTSKASGSKMKQLERKGIEVIRCGTKRVDVRKLMQLLGKRGITSLLVEGGGEVNASCIEAGIVNKIIIPIAPKIIGGRDAKTPVEGTGAEHVKDALRLKDVSVERIGDDIVICGYMG